MICHAYSLTSVEREKELLPTLELSWRASAVSGEEAGRFHEVAGVSTVVAGGPRSATNTKSIKQTAKWFKKVVTYCLLLLSLRTLQGAVPR